MRLRTPSSPIPGVVCASCSPRLSYPGRQYAPRCTPLLTPREATYPPLYTLSHPGRGIYTVVHLSHTPRGAYTPLYTLLYTREEHIHRYTPCGIPWDGIYTVIHLRYTRDGTYTPLYTLWYTRVCTPRIYTLWYILVGRHAWYIPLS